MSFKIIVKSITGRNIEVSVDESTLVCELKKKIYDQELYPEANQILKFENDNALDDAAKLSFYKVQAGSVLELSVSTVDIVAEAGQNVDPFKK